MKKQLPKGAGCGLSPARVWRVIVAALMLLAVNPMHAQFSGSGTGTASDPYKIFNPNHLAQVKNFVGQSGVYFELMADVDMAQWISKNSPTDGWAPIGTESSPFKGTFKGNNHTIKGITINRPSSSNVGLFGYMSGATVQDLAIDADVTGGSYTGILAGYAVNCEVSNVTYSGRVSGSTNVGGLVGYTSRTSGEKGTYTNCFGNASVSGTSNVGGLAGNANVSVKNEAITPTLISNCNFKGSVTGSSNYVGGLIGLLDAITTTGYYSNSSYWINRASIITIAESNVDADITGTSKVGGLVGQVKNFYSSYHYSNGGATNITYSTTCSFNISHCSAVGSVKGIGSQIGGFIGQYTGTSTKFSEALINNCFYVGNVTGGEDTGGLIGTTDGATSFTMQNSYSCGMVSGTNHVGGIVGDGSSLTINKCYTSANVSGSQYVAGIAGYSTTSAKVTVKSSVVLSEYINASLSYGARISNAGLVGENGTASANKGCVETMVSANGKSVNTGDSNASGENLSTEMLKMRATYQGIGWNFTNDWAIQETESYPYNKEQTAPPVITSDIISGAVMLRGKCISGGKVTVEIAGERFEADCDNTNWSMRVNPLKSGEIIRVYAKAPDKAMSYFAQETVRFPGSGTEEDPYLIYTVSDLQNIAGEYYYKLMNDLDLSDIDNWMPIGTLKASVANLDGDNHTIKGLKINRPDTDYIGLFANASNATIKNLNVVEANVKGGAYTAILVGNGSNLTIENCTVSGSVNAGDKNYAGLLTGKITNPAISNCSLSGELTGGQYVGAVSGSASNGSINAVASQATVIGSTYVGGLVGNSAGAKIESCSVQGSVKAIATDAQVGGIAAKSSGKISDCFVTADITASAASTDGYLGGIVALNTGKIEHCYASGELSGQRRAAGISGYNDGAQASTTGCVAANSRIILSSENPIGMRVLGGFRNGAPMPDTSDNYASEQMILSFNDIPQDIYDDPLNGLSKATNLLKNKDTYTSLGWDFANVWRIAGDAMPQLQATATGGGDATGYDNFFSIAPFQAYGGSQVVMPVNLTNRDGITTFQFDLMLPTGVTIAEDEDGFPLIELSDRVTRQHQLSYQAQPDGSMRVLVSSSASRFLIGNEGEVVNITLNFDKRIVNGQYNIALKHVYLSDDKATNIVGPMTFGSVTVLNDWMESAAVNVMRGNKVQVSVDMLNRSQIVGYQFDVRLPEGVEIARNAVGDYDLTFGERSSAARHNFSMKEREDGTIRIVAHSMTNELFTGSEGAAFTMNLAVDENVAPGLYHVEFTNVYLVTPDALSIKAPDFTNELTIEQARRKGDVNLDGIINTADASGVLVFIHGGDSSKLDFYAADIDDNGNIATNDYTGVLPLILNESLHAPGRVKPVSDEAKDIRADYVPPSEDDYAYTPNLHYFIEPFTIKPGEEKVLKVMLDNPDVVVVNGQFDILLPEGLEMVLWEDPLDENDYWMEVGSRANKRQYTSLTASNQPDGSVRFVIVSPVYGAKFSGTHGDVLKVAVKASEDMKPGVYTANMKFMFLSDPEAVSLHAPKYETTIVVGENNDSELALKGRMSDLSIAETNELLAKNAKIHTLDLTGVGNVRSENSTPFASANPNMMILLNDDTEVANTANVAVGGKVENLQLTAGFPFAVKAETEAVHAEFHMPVTAGNCESAVIPFEVEQSSLPAAMVCSGYDQQANAFKFASAEAGSKVEANTPVMFTAESTGDMTISAEAVTVYPYNPELAPEEPALIGNYLAQEAPEHCYELRGLTFSAADEMKPFGVYAVGTDLIAAPSVKTDATGIAAITADSIPEDAEIYNLQGLRVNGDPSALPTGIYIINGRKALLRN